MTSEDNRFELLVHSINNLTNKIDVRINQSETELRKEINSLRSEIDNVRAVIIKLNYNLATVDEKVAIIKTCQKDIEEVERRHNELSNQFYTTKGRDTLVSSIIGAIVGALLLSLLQASFFNKENGDDNSFILPPDQRYRQVLLKEEYPITKIKS